LSAFVHAMQAPVHAASQQMPSAQKVLTHSAPVVQAWGVQPVAAGYF